MPVRLVLIALLTVVLCACGRSTPTNYYMLESGQGPLTAESIPKKSLRIAQVEAPAYLNRNNIVSRVQNQTKLILAEFHLWAEPVGAGVRRVVEEIITPVMLQNGVNVLPFGTEEKGDYVLLLDLQRLDGNFNEKAALESYWTLMDRDDHPVARGIFSAEEQVQGANYNVLVEAESALVRDLAQYLAKTLPKYLQDRSRSRR